MISQYTRFRAYHIPNGCAYSYVVNKEFCLVGGRYHRSMVSSLREEMRIAGCDTIDILHLPSWNERLCNARELEELLGIIRPTEIEIPAYIPESRNGKDCRRVVMEYCSQSSITELSICTPKLIKKNKSNGVKIIVSPLKEYRTPEDNDLVEFFGKGRFTMLSTGYVKSLEIAHEIAQNDKLRNLDVLILHGINGNPFARFHFINKVDAKIIIDVTDDNQYYRRSDVILEDYGISTLKTDNGEVIITSGENDMDYEIDTPLLAPSIGGSYRMENLDQYSLNEQIQEYVWTHAIDDLDSLCHHYEVDDISDISIVSAIENGDSTEMNLTLSISAILYIDNEDEEGFAMRFPAEFKANFEKIGDKYRIYPETVEIKVNTDEYYR